MPRQTAVKKAAPKSKLTLRLRTEGLVKTYHQRRVVNDVAISVTQGEVVGLLGPNGAGKTTTFYMVVGMIHPDAGRVVLEDMATGLVQEVTGLPMHERAVQGIGYLAQEASIFRQLSVEDNLMAILEHLPLSPEERLRRKDRLLDEFHVGPLAKQKAYTLSGGERRRVEIARALTTDPKFLLLDEPFVGIDPIAVLDIQNIIGQLAQKGIGVLITDHNVRETLAIIDRAYILYQGQVLLSGSAQQLATNEQARKIYLGEKFTL
jgi:lipopolysaccharide export system ATP-binding protein